jgi:hypothetical protein
VTRSPAKIRLIFKSILVTRIVASTAANCGSYFSNSVLPKILDVFLNYTVKPFCLTASIL